MNIDLIESEVIFKQEFLNILRDNKIFWQLKWVYRSNWRFLHIDGFETGRSMPISTGNIRVCFNYEALK
jgi:hypothetical protein